jgi:DNA-binding CsgD family transcriptional regulator
VVQIVFASSSGAFHLSYVTGGCIQKKGNVILREAFCFTNFLYPVNDGQIEFGFSCFFHKTLSQETERALPSSLENSKDLTKHQFLNKVIPQTESQKEIYKSTLLSLPEDQQRVLLLMYEKGMPVREIALKMNCSVTTIYNKLHRALFKLKNVLTPEAFEAAYRILYPETGKPITIASSIASGYDQENNQSIV